MTGGSTRVFAILGDPLKHTLSPAMHNAAFRALGLDATYVPLRCSAADVPGVGGTHGAMRSTACASGRRTSTGACQRLNTAAD